MGKNLPLAVLAILALLSAQACATTFTKNFIYNYYGVQNAYVNTDVELSPAISVPSGQTVYCVGDTFTPSISFYSDWYSSVYDAQLTSSATYGGCLVTPCSTHNNTAINWANNAQFNLLLTPDHYNSVSDFTTKLANNNIPSNTPGECSKYLNQSNQPFVVNGNSLFKSDIGAFCRGTLSLVSSNSAYNRVVASEYTGSIPAINPPIILNTASSSLTFNAKFDANDCIISGRTYASGCFEGVWMYYSQAGAFPVSSQSTSVTITVKNPFSCNLVSLTNAQVSPTTNVQPGQQLSFAFNVLNPTTNGESVKINAVGASWAFSQPVVTGGLPQTFANNGVSYTVSGTFTAPPTAGTYNFNLTVNYSSANADCSGATKNCNASFPFTITVSPSNPVNCTIAFENHGTTFTPLDTAWVNATCRASNNAIVPCGQLSWTTTAASGSMAPPTTTSPSRSQLTVAGVSAPQTNAIVKAQNGTTFNCTILLNVTAPDYIPLLSAPPQVQVNAQFTANITTKDIGAAANVSTVTKMRFGSLTQPFSVGPLAQQGMQPNSSVFICPPTPNLYELNATVDSNNQLNESNESNNFATMMVNCTAAPPVLKPDYISAISAPLNVPVGDPLPINVTTTNIGQAAAANNSTTRLLISGYGSSTSFDFIIPALGPNGGSATNSASNVHCPQTPGDLALLSTADYFGQINESNESNNNDTFTVHCVPGNLPNYVPNITAPSLAFVGHDFIANFTTKNSGTANATNYSTTHTTFQGAAHDFLVVPLAANAQQADWSNLSCASAGAKNIVERVNNYGNVTESTYADNEQAWSVACYNPPDSCNLSFVGHSSTLFINDFAQVQAACYNGGAQTACPPFLWQQNALGGAMSPINTPANFAPNSTLITFMAPSPQLGRKMNATSALSGVPLYCELPFTVSDGSPIGPDYIITSIQPDHPTSAIGQVVQFTVTVLNRGNVNATNISISTAIFSPGCTIITNKDSYSLPAIPAHASDISVNKLACTCFSAGAQNITVSANPTHAQSETDFTNNDRTEPFICQPPFPTITCSYFV